MKKTEAKQMGRMRRHARIRSRVVGTLERPRLAVYRSNKYLYAQLINDETNTTLAAIDTRKVTGENPIERAKAAGTTFAGLAKKANVSAIVFDRGGFQYQGAIAAFADAARAGGLTF